jgi:hypothetical protein
MTQEECTKLKKLTQTHQKASRTRCALRFVDTAIGELEVHRHKLPPMEEICQFCQAVKWKDDTANSCSCSGKVVLAQLHDPPQEFKQLFKDPLFLAKVRFYKSICALMSVGSKVKKNAWIDKQLENALEGVYMLRVQGTICHHVGTLPPDETRTPSSAQLYVFNSDMEAQVNM